MKKSILIAMVTLFTYNAAKAGNVPPVPVLTSTPSQSWFYNLEDVVFSSSSSYDTDGYVNYSKFYINGVLKKSISYMGSYSTCFALYGSPAGDCYVLANGVTTVSVKLEVRDNSGEWSSTTTVYTIQEHKGRKYFLTDHLGNVRTTVNRDGNVLGYDDYYAFGLSMPGSHSSNTSNPNDTYKFTGHERDDEAGLTIDYMNARTYDPVIGRFMQVDPKYELYKGWTPYHYTLNNPLKFTDPTGECIKELPCPTLQDLKNGINKTYQQGKSLLGLGNFDVNIRGNITWGANISGEVERFGGFTANAGSIELITFDTKIEVSDDALSITGDYDAVEKGEDIVFTQEASVSGLGLNGSLDHTFSLNNSTGTTYVTNQEVSATIGAGVVQYTGTDNLKNNTSRQTGTFDFGMTGAFLIGGNLDISIKIWEDDKTEE